MSFNRGRGRGRGYGGGGGAPAKPFSFELFPDNKGIGTATNVKEDKTLGIWHLKFDRFFKSSPYYIEDGDDSSKKLKIEQETFSNRGSVKKAPKGRLSDFIYMDPIYVPAELAKGYKMGKIGVKRVKWNPESDKLQLEGVFEKRLEEHNKKVKEFMSMKGEEEEEEDAVNEEEDDELDDDDDYIQNIDFDDDEDPFNEPEEENDEGAEF